MHSDNLNSVDQCRRLLTSLAQRCWRKQKCPFVLFTAHRNCRTSLDSYVMHLKTFNNPGMQLRAMQSNAVLHCPQPSLTSLEWSKAPPGTVSDRAPETTRPKTISFHHFFFFFFSTSFQSFTVWTFPYIFQVLLGVLHRLKLL